MKFLEDYCYSYVNNLSIFGISAKRLFESCSIYIMPMVNPDGVDLVFTDILLKNITVGIYLKSTV